MDAIERCCAGSYRTQGPIAVAIDPIVPRAAHFETPFGVARREPGPPHEVPDRRRTMTAKISPRQLRKRFVARQSRGARRPLRQKRVRRLLATLRTAAQDALELGVNCQQREANACHDEAGTREMCAQFGTSQILAAAEGPFEELRG